MKQIVNFIITFLILYLGNIVAPKHIASNNWKTILFATTIIFIAEIVIEFIGFIFALITTFLGNVLHSKIIVIILCIFTLITYFASGIVALKIATNVIPNFAINGIWTYIIVAILMIILSVSDNSNKNSNNKRRNYENY